MIPAPQDRPALRVLLLEDDVDSAGFLATSLRDRGHDVECHDHLEEGLDVHLFDVVVTDDGVGLHMDGAAVLDALGVREAGVPAIVVSGRHDFGRCRRAMRRGAVDFLVRPFALPTLAHAIEAVAEGSTSPAHPSAFVRHYLQGAEARERLLAELGAYLMEGGLGPVHRIRIATAVALILEHLHVRRGGAPVRLEVVRAGERVTADVAAMGRMALSAVQPALPFAEGESPVALETRRIEHARALVEGLELRSAPTHEAATLTFALTPAGFDEDELDLSNADYVDPRSIDRLIAALLEGAEDQAHMIPTSMATTVGRLLAIAHRNRTVESSLWS